MPVRKSRKRQVFVLVAILMSVILMAYPGYQITKPQRDARRILKTLQHVQLGHTHVEEVTGQSPDSWVTGSLETGQSYHQLVVTNKLLHSMRLAPLAAIVVNITADHGTVNSLAVTFAVGESGSTAPVHVFQVKGYLPGYGGNICIRDGSPTKVDITVSPTASSDERNRFLDLNTYCFSKIGGCKDAHELLPISETQ